MHKIQTSHGLAILGICFLLSLFLINQVRKQFDLLTQPIPPLNQTASVSDFDDALVGHWKFDEGSGIVATDSSRNRNSGILVNSPTWTTDSMVGGKALRFDGMDDYLSVGNLSSLNISASTTVSLWFKTGGPASPSDAVIVGKSQVGGGGNGYAFIQGGTGGSKNVYFLVSGASASASASYTNDDRWHHLVGVYDQMNVVFYVDGVSRATTPKTGSVSSSAYNFYICKREGSSVCKGNIDDVRVYNRALSGGEISELYNLGISSGVVSDTEAPSIPTGLASANIQANQVTLSWTASTDNVGVTGYRIYRNRNLLTSTSATTYIDTGLSSLTSYSYTISAYDDAGNSSSQSVAHTITTISLPSAGTTPPALSNIQTFAVSDNSVTINWNTDKLSDSQIEYGMTTSYGLQTVLNSVLTSSHSQVINGLSANTLYHYRVKSKDQSNNQAISADQTFTTMSQITTTGEHIYVAQTTQGNNSGSNCNNARPIAWLNTYGNWGTGTNKIGHGDTIHLCGTISEGVNFQGEGTVNNPITLYFEPGAKISAPTWTRNSIIYLGRKSWITIDGGTNGIVEATDNGTGAQYGGAYSNQNMIKAIYGENLTHLTVKNLTIQNIYVRKPSSNDPARINGQDVSGAGIIIIGGSDILIQNNKIINANELIGILWGANAANITVDNNILLNTNHAITISNNSPGGSITNVIVSRNKIDGMDVWEGWEFFHRNGLFLFTNYTDSTMTNVYVYNNRVGPGINPQTITAGTGGLDNQRPIAPGMFKNVYVFNNIADLKAPLNWSQAFINVSGENSLVANNTVVGWSNSEGCHGGPAIGVGGISGNAEAYNNLVYCTRALMSQSMYENYPFTNIISDYNIFFNKGFKPYASFNTLIFNNGGWGTAIDNAWYDFESWQASSPLNRDPHSLNIDPQLVNPDTSNGNYHLQATSPARNAGKNLTSYCSIVPELCFDYEGNPRPATGAWDIGAYQYAGNVPPPPSPQPSTCTSFIYSNWGTCSNNQQIRTVLSSIPSGCTGGTPVMTQSCAIALGPDTTLPTVSITSPVLGAILNPQAITVSANASDPLSPSGQATSGIVGVQFMINGQNLGSEDTSSPYSVIWNTTSLPDGSYSLSARARDTAGNTTTSQSVTVTLSTPVTPPVTPADSDNDGIADSLDICPSTPPSLSSITPSIINTRGCPIPRMSTFSIRPDLSNIDLRSVSPSALPGNALELGNSHGKVSYSSDSITLTRGTNHDRLDIDSNLDISQYSISLDSLDLPELNRPARLTFYNVPTPNPRILRDGAICSTCTGASYDSSNRSFSFSVTGFSTFALDITFSTEEDATPPIVINDNTPTSLPAGATNTILSVTTDEGATCKYSTTPNTPYSSMTNTFIATEGTAHSSTVHNFSNGQTYTYYVKCEDTEGNASASDLSLSFSVANPAPVNSSGGGGGGGGSSRRATVSNTNSLITTALNPSLIRVSETSPLLTLPPITRRLILGMTHPEVRVLQQILNALNYTVSLRGAGSKGQETSYFGPATEKALRSFQCKVIFICSGTSNTTGYGSTGPRTRAALNAKLTTSNSQQTTPPQSTEGATASKLSFTFTRNLLLGSTGQDVKNLQIFLNSRGFTVSQKGNGSAGHETSYFGPATRSALIRFQEYYRSDILIPNRLTKGTGYFGPATIRKVNDLTNLR